MRIDVITIFPGMFDPVLGESILKRAQRKGKIKIKIHDLRDYTSDAHRSVDDKPFGGGPGMVMKIEPIYKAVNDILGKRGKKGCKVILLTPRGKKFDQKTARRISGLKRILLICGHYEGVDERVKRLLADEELSIGDYVLTGGELPAMVLIDAVARLIPGVLGHEKSNMSESFENNVLEYPQYTRPSAFLGLEVPKVLLSGNHKKVDAWRHQESLKITKKKRPDLLRR